MMINWENNGMGDGGSVTHILGLKDLSPWMITTASGIRLFASELDYQSQCRQGVASANSVCGF